mgnify:FL=1
MLNREGVSKLINFEEHSKNAYSSLPESIQKSSVGEAIADIQKNLASTHSALDLAYFNGFVERFCTYIQLFQSDEAEQLYPERKFILSANIHDGKGGIVLPPQAYVLSDAIRNDNIEEYVKENSIPEGYKVIRQDITEEAERIIEQACQTIAKNHMSMNVEYLEEHLTVKNAETDNEGIVRYIQFTEEYMKSLLPSE